MKLDDDDDPIFSEWSSQANAMAFPSLAPQEISLDEEFYTPVSVSPERRARLLRYVKATMACCVALCAAAIVRVGVSHVLSPSEESVPQMIVASEVTIGAESAEPAAAPAPLVPASPRDSAPIPAPPMTASPPVALSPVVSRPMTLPPIAPSSIASPSAAGAAPVATAPAATKVARAITPLQEREAARQALERGKAKEAAAAAARATAGDPGDAEAWLILGAADQELGRSDAARDAFHSCVKSAKRGPVRECASMLR